MVDIAIVGAGPVGLAAACEAKKLGLSHVVFDRGPVANTILRFPRDMVFFSEARNIEIAGHPLVSSGPKPTRREALVYFQKVAEREALNVKPYTEVVGISGSEGGFRIHTRNRRGEHQVPARAVVVATGYFDCPNRLGVPGEDLPHVHHRYEEAARYFGCQVTVVGGSNSAVEAALDLYRAGARVTLVHRGTTLRPGVKYWLAPDFENRVREGSVGALFETTVKAFTPEGLRLLHRGQEVFLEADFVLVLIGFRANDALLRQAGVAFDGERPVLSPELETSIPGLFAVGSCAYGADTRTVFIENGREEAKRAVTAVARKLGKL
ncbi:MAG: YpdA family putative bacillithiol disulfide reductase [Thermoanaerobaculum sp.]